MLEKRLGWGIYSFLVQLASGVDPVPGIKWVTLVGVDTDGMVHLMYSLFSVWVGIYLTRRCLFACLGDLPVKGLSLVLEIPHEAFMVRQSVCAVLRLDRVTRLGGTPP